MKIRGSAERSGFYLVEIDEGYSSSDDGRSVVFIQHGYVYLIGTEEVVELEHALSRRIIKIIKKLELDEM
jgi:hypothetical protein